MSDERTGLRHRRSFYSGIQIPNNQKPQLLKSGLKIGVTQAPL
jgi:hypothetical protein